MSIRSTTKQDDAILYEVNLGTGAPLSEENDTSGIPGMVELLEKARQEMNAFFKGNVVSGSSGDASSGSGVKRKLSSHAEHAK